MDRSKGFFITVICFVYFVICVLAVVYFFFSNFSFFSLDYITPVSFLGTLLTIPQALFLMSIFILITSLILLSKIKSMFTFFKKATYCTDPQKLDQNLTIRRSVFLWQNIVSNSRRKSF